MLNYTGFQGTERLRYDVSNECMICMRWNFKHVLLNLYFTYERTSCYIIVETHSFYVWHTINFLVFNIPRFIAIVHQHICAGRGVC